jgi:hypothetical protein
LLNCWQNAAAEARPLAEEGLAIYRELGDQPGVAFALLVLGLACEPADHDAGCALMNESLALYRTLGDKAGAAEALGWLGFVETNKDQARARLSR